MTICDHCKKEITPEDKLVEIKFFYKLLSIVPEAMWKLHWECFEEKAKSM